MAAPTLFDSAMADARRAASIDSPTLVPGSRVARQAGYHYRRAAAALVALFPFRSSAADLEKPQQRALQYATRSLQLGFDASMAAQFGAKPGALEFPGEFRALLDAELAKVCGLRAPSTKSAASASLPPPREGWLARLSTAEQQSRLALSEARAGRAAVALVRVKVAAREAVDAASASNGRPEALRIAGRVVDVSRQIEMMAGGRGGGGAGTSSGGGHGACGHAVWDGEQTLKVCLSARGEAGRFRAALATDKALLALVVCLDAATEVLRHEVDGSDLARRALAAAADAVRFGRDAASLFDGRSAPGRSLDALSRWEHAQARVLEAGGAELRDSIARPVPPAASAGPASGQAGYPFAAAGPASAPAAARGQAGPSYVPVSHPHAPRPASGAARPKPAPPRLGLVVAPPPAGTHGCGPPSFSPMGASAPGVAPGPPPATAGREASRGPSLPAGLGDRPAPPADPSSEVWDL